MISHVYISFAHLQRHFCSTERTITSIACEVLQLVNGKRTSILVFYITKSLSLILLKI